MKCLYKPQLECIGDKCKYFETKCKADVYQFANKQSIDMLKDTVTKLSNIIISLDTKIKRMDYRIDYLKRKENKVNVRRSENKVARESK